MARQGGSAQREEMYQENGGRRNPYLVDYEGQRRRRPASGVRPVNPHRQTSTGRTAHRVRPEGGYAPAGRGRASASPAERYGNPSRSARTVSCDLVPGARSASRDLAPGARSASRALVPGARPASRDLAPGARSASRDLAPGARSASRALVPGARPASRDLAPGARPASRALVPETRPASRRVSPARQRAAARRKKKQLLMQKLLVCGWVLCIMVFAAAFAVRSNQDGQKEDALPPTGELEENQTPQASGLSVQGLPAEKFAEHPEWTEDLLTPNEYSRPGNALEEVNNIFVHYTANPGTSAAQNRSYFEWQKDTHEASVSAHFVIGYEGEIIQCVPLDEIAYAVMTRNYDSISIECCYLEKDGSFTQATYDSLISLLAWLVDAYDLESEDILRHYDCGGKKCPLYYTEHPGAWEQLKKDVDNL
ncbi:N-acetylmuramoyl-L-alanine amidase family protein [uncultured Acetatifactor sp.]|uniref:peptidoglycan recognition protein family protein n=1 Tax=uncultured Acetatifactor sp. TaxID=1671927 RepID=UPI00261E3B21|nr:N-acetylmuramoyl-L-alanine amidase [uncultured Acetatifactor sp.]